ncbi:hypothetical protein [Streptomyces sp. CC208A]|uniref:hypothetical protein n=1 Tax=Streptomyces sp. CC208A TaxID=3044573 RepID=UPI0024A99362|nr:hypothetical protein [Streptomyces sp. CC208A]
MAWLCAEYLADQYLTAAGLAEPGSLEHRASLRALALTVHLSGEPAADEWLRLTSYEAGWPGWVEERLAAEEAEDPGGADLALARGAWRALRETWVHAADLDAVPGGGPVLLVDETARTWLPAWRLGLPLAHLAVWLA